ncbi:8-oxo-dGTP diphosphatase MutT [Acidocella aromatica]|uniref:8-oxo-dGTP diphosphatase n=1 Tax=Acidocella aromatica TaxID=1303579 RepID=A0A840VIC1_9PROT|nr:8-oxo-dGTP diphosphatase MutT [Acidocella aromatica]MBB5372039.1 8-oxo-dGTP diphosphatase [Acidocella aromatica]
MPDLNDSPMLETLPPPGPVLRTTRLVLRPLHAGDAAHFHRLINDWEICRRLPDAPFPYPAQLAADWIDAALADREAARAEQFAMVEAETGALVGVAGLRLGKGQKTAELGYWLGRAHWGQGYALEAARRLLDWAFAALPLSHVTATVAADNEGSMAVLRKLGFAQTSKGLKSFMCRPGQKLPVKHFTRERELLASGIAAEAPKGGTLLVAAAALIDSQGRILLARRPEGKKMAGLWEFPGGKLEPGETPEAALARELREELGLETNPKDFAPFVFASHAYDSFHLLMPVFLCRRWKGEPQPKEGQALAWVAPDRLVEYPMPPADRPLIPMLRDFL